MLAQSAQLLIRSRGAVNEASQMRGGGETPKSFRQTGCGGRGVHGPPPGHRGKTALIGASRGS
ncbi:hypothetical protein COCOBI_pt-1910 (chloroplast) [Coccomyxa sp. Obi]|nr:hypothetical protein COCOBI_pt-1910 [Coccomyxa sp. Obi]